MLDRSGAGTALRAKISQFDDDMASQRCQGATARNETLKSEADFARGYYLRSTDRCHLPMLEDETELCEPCFAQDRWQTTGAGP